MARRCEDCGRSFRGGSWRHYCPACVLERQTKLAYMPDALAILKARIEVHRQKGQEAIAAALERRLKEEVSRRPGSGGARPAT